MSDALEVMRADALVLLKHATDLTIASLPPAVIVDSQSLALRSIMILLMAAADTAIAMKMTDDSEQMLDDVRVKIALAASIGMVKQ